jgi:hypothetical protein
VSRQEQAAGRAAALAALGPFFAVHLHAAGPAPPGPAPPGPAPPGPALPGPWRPLTALASPAGLAGMVAQTRAGLAGGRPAAAVETRVAASVTHLGLAARLISPALGMAVLFGMVPRMDPAEVQWQPAAGGPVPLSLPAAALAPDAPARAIEPAGAAPEPATTAEAASIQEAARIPDLAAELAVLLAGPVGLVTDAIAAMSVSRTVLRGNVASALHGAATVIGAARPGLAGRATGLCTALLGSPPLAGAGTVTADGFRRGNCCLIYRAAEPAGRAFCADCVLRR